MRVHILHKLPTPYNDTFFRAISLDPRVELQVHHLWRGSAQRPWQSELGTGYPNRYMAKHVDGPFLRRAWTDREAAFVLVDWAHLVTLLAIAIRVIRRAPVALWVDTPQEQLPRNRVFNLFRRSLLRIVLRRVTLVFGTGEPARKVLLEMGMPGASFMDLPCAVDVEGIAQRQSQMTSAAKAYRRDLGIGTGDAMLLMVGSAIPKKGFDIGLKAFALVAKAKPNARLFVAGAGPDEPELVELAERLALSDRFAFLGWLEPDRMELLFAACDVMVHPARYDPFPLAVLEAMAWGKPVVGSATSGSVIDRVVDDYSGYVVPAEDVDALADAVLKAIQPGAASRLGRGALATAIEWPLSREVDIFVAGCRRMLRVNGT